MKKEVTASGKTILEAKENARLALGASELDDVTYEILHAGSKGKGVSYMENNVSWHGNPPNDEQYEQAMAELKAQRAELEA